MAWVAIVYALFPVVFVTSAAFSEISNLSTSSLIPQKPGLSNFREILILQGARPTTVDGDFEIVPEDRLPVLDGWLEELAVATDRRTSQRPSGSHHQNRRPRGSPRVSLDGAAASPPQRA